jgi:hypothetical protein
MTHLKPFRGSLVYGASDGADRPQGPEFRQPMRTSRVIFWQTSLQSLSSEQPVEFKNTLRADGQLQTNGESHKNKLQPGA